MSEQAWGMTEQEMRERVVKLAFDGDERRLEEFCEVVRAAVPEGTTVVLRGSSVTGERYDDGAPFDADGPGTSDLDVTLVGGDAMGYWHDDAYYIPALHTKPHGDKDPDIAPALEPLRRRLQEMAGRPVNFQATSDLILFARDVLLGQPYFTIIEAGEDA